MPIVITCSQCRAKLQVPDSAAGREAECPNCRIMLPIPVPTPVPTDNSPAAGGSPGGGGVDWGSIDSGSANSAGGGGGIDWGESESSSTFGAGASRKPSSPSPYGYGSASPQRTQRGSVGMINTSTVFGYAWQVFKNNMGLLLAVSATTGVLGLVQNVLKMIMRNTDDNAVLTACSSGSLVLSLLSLFIGIGAVRIALKLCRGQQTNYGHLFSGGDCFLQVLGWGFLVLIPLLISVLLLVIPFFILISIFWPSYYLIVDRKTGVFDSFPLAMKMGMPNMGSGIVLMLASIGIVIGGLVALGIGIIFAGAYLMVLWSTAYLMMTGEVS